MLLGVLTCFLPLEYTDLERGLTIRSSQVVTCILIALGSLLGLRTSHA